MFGRSEKLGRQAEIAPIKSFLCPPQVTTRLVNMTTISTYDFKGTAVKFAAVPKIDKGKLDSSLIESEKLDSDAD